MCSRLQPRHGTARGLGVSGRWGRGVSVSQGRCWDPAALRWVAQGGRGKPPVPHFGLTPASSPVEIIHAPSGSGLVRPCRAHRQPHRLVQ